MRRIEFFSVLGFILLLVSCGYDSSVEITNDWKSYSGDPVIERKVDSVLNLMTLDEKIGQLNQYSGNFAVTGEVTDTKSGEYLKKGMIGSTFNVFGADHVRMLQEQNLKYSRLKIPMLFAADVIHGLETTFPIPLAEACSWDLQLMEKSARIAAEEATASGVAWNFAPMVDISRDPRWGRIMEGAGEDPFLGSLIARARVRGFQGIDSYKDFSKPNTMMACAKHFVGYGAAQAGRDYHTVDISERTLFETYLPPFKAAVDEGVASFMTAFNELNGVPCTGNKYIFQDILRHQWNFNGMVVTDYTAIQEMVAHGFAKDLKQASKLAIDAGIDMDMISEGFVTYLKELVEEGQVSEKQIDVAVARILEMKFLLGLFDDPYKYCDAEREKEVLMNPQHLQAAREVAQRSIVLLKNENNVLPLRKDIPKRVALIGPFVKERESLNGEWAIKGDRSKSVTLWEGLQEKYADTPVRFNYAKGTSLPLIDGATRHVSLEQGFDKSGFAEALRVAKTSDLILVAMGEHYHWSGEAASRTDITLPGNQRELLKELKKTGKPIVLVLFNGRPLDLSWEAENVDAIVEAWYPGIMAGHAVADVLSGDYNPSARLVVTFPRNVGQIPIFYNMKNTGRPFDENHPADYKSSYIDSPNSPLFPFGFGLSYTSFQYDNATISSQKLTKGGSLIVSVDVTNTGNVDGEEVVQLYIHDKVGSVTRPVKELKGFKKIFLKKGETKTVEFTINEEMLKMYNINMDWVAEPGEFDVWVACNSADESNHLEFELID
ncbi:beta-glucosidase BglX [Thermophagus xiamenensis]|uniref:Periplasmic beta-glucosidase n=1 Tax=Thermophagus xiamenensis TaxID=385682 RepID=A0A1I2AIV3_9BACT|nr:beta-glucosidase BglX [Thermophagus xiamenensis]SFE42760.1 beta-glucosidase [Thermophagus xiamenensis]